MSRRPRRKQKSSVMTQDAALASLVVKDIPEDAVPVGDTAHQRIRKIIKPVKSPGLAYNGSRNRGSFKASDYNLSDIANAVDKEALVRRSVQKMRYLIWKNGHDFIGNNPGAVNYIRERFRQIAMVSHIPTAQLFRDLADQLVTYHNAFIAKVRKTDASGGVLRTDPFGKQLEPVAAYYSLCATTMQIDKDQHGNVRKYRQVVPGYPESEWPEFLPHDMIHIYMDRKVGLSTGTPYIIPALDDIRALRSMEENIERLVHQNAMPLYHYRIGTPEEPATPQEVDDMKYELQKMPSNGGIATPERHEIKVIGAEGQALDASDYLEHFMRRVRGALHLSSVDWGEGDSSSRGTSITMTRDTRDTVEEYQDVIRIFVNFEMINELLLEGGFSWDAYDDRNRVELFIPPIDLEEQVKRENHVAQMYQSNIITEDEARGRIGEEPFRDEERGRTFFNLITKPMLLLKAQTAGDGSSPSVRSADMPSNQHGTQLSKPLITKEELMDDQGDTILTEDAYDSGKLKVLGFDHANVMAQEQWRTFRNGVLDLIRSDSELVNIWEDGLDNQFVNNSISQINGIVMMAYRAGFDQTLHKSVSLSQEDEMKVQADATLAVFQVERAYRRLVDDAHRRVGQAVIADTPIASSTAALDALQHRVPTIVATGLLRAKNFGRARSLGLQGHTELIIPGCCDHPSRILAIGRGIDYSALPPDSTHPNCLCEIIANSVA
jgi:hypothetical protein